LAYASELVQDYLAMEIEQELLELQRRLEHDDDAPHRELWVTTEPAGAQTATVSVRDAESGAARSIPVYLRHENIARHLPGFIEGKHGLADLFTALRHDPVYWVQILDPGGRPVFQSGDRPENAKNFAAYPLDRSLPGYTAEIVYTSFGPKQLYSVAKNRINFGLISFLFVLVFVSLFLLTRSIRQKLALARQKTFFVNTVSHEFKTPLAILALAAETLESKRYRTPDEEQRFFRMMVNEIHRLDHLVHKVLNYSKIETGQTKFQIQRFDLREVLEDSAEQYQIRARAEGVDLVVEITETTCPIEGDKAWLRHACDNILDNAFKYRAGSIRIDAVCDRNENEAWISIIDRGVGIAPDEISQIQRSFYRVDNPETRGVRGSGLGLAVAKYALKQMKGRLLIRSAPGEGSCFTMRFPLRPEGSGATAAAGPVIEPNS
jgi:signal transduction histidine kinase